MNGKVSRHQEFNIPKPPGIKYLSAFRGFSSFCRMFRTVGSGPPGLRKEKCMTFNDSPAEE